MKILAIDSATETLSICVAEDTNILGEYTIKNLKTHSPKIVPMIDELLKNIELTLKDIDVFGINIGPGSFTGIRIGLSLAKSFAQAKDKPIVGINSLESLAKQVNAKDVLICPMLDAKNDNVYTGVLDNGCEIVPLDCMNILDLLEKCNGLDKQIFFIGDGAEVHKDTILEKIPNKKIYAIQNAYLSAKEIAYLTYERATNGKLDDYITLSPMYLRASAPERGKNE